MFLQIEPMWTLVVVEDGPRVTKQLVKLQQTKKKTNKKTAKRFQKHSTKTLHPPENVLSGISFFSTFIFLLLCYSRPVVPVLFCHCCVLISCAAALCLNQLLQCLKSILVGGNCGWNKPTKKVWQWCFCCCCCCFAFHFSAVERKNANKTQINRM